MTAIHKSNIYHNCLNPTTTRHQPRNPKTAKAENRSSFYEVFLNALFLLCFVYSFSSFMQFTFDVCLEFFSIFNYQTDVFLYFFLFIHLFILSIKTWIPLLICLFIIYLGIYTVSKNSDFVIYLSTYLFVCLFIYMNCPISVHT